MGEGRAGGSGGGADFRPALSRFRLPEIAHPDHPQFRVASVRPTEEVCPVDIAVFPSSKHLEDDVFMIVECKKNRKDESNNSNFTRHRPPVGVVQRAGNAH